MSTSQGATLSREWYRDFATALGIELPPGRRAHRRVDLQPDRRDQGRRQVSPERRSPLREPGAGSTAKRPLIPREYRRLYRELLIQRDGRRCRLCHARIDFSLTEGPWRVTFDHIIERSKGGGNELGNLQLAHWYCNEAKSNPMPAPPPFVSRRQNATHRPHLSDLSTT